jgi:hypothetical protein
MPAPRSGYDLALRPPISRTPEIGALAPWGEVATNSALILRNRAQRDVSKNGRVSKLAPPRFNTGKRR